MAIPDATTWLVCIVRPSARVIHLGGASTNAVRRTGVAVSKHLSILSALSEPTPLATTANRVGGHMAQGDVLGSVRPQSSPSA